MRLATGEAFTRSPAPFADAPSPLSARAGSARSSLSVTVSSSSRSDSASSLPSASSPPSFSASCFSAPPPGFPAGFSPGSPMRAITSPIGSVSPSPATISISVPSVSAS